MSPLPFLRWGFTTALLFSVILLNPLQSKAQEKEEDKPIGRYLYAIRFEVPDLPQVTADEFTRIQSLLDAYKKKIPAEIQSKFNVKGEAAGKRPELSEIEEATLRNITREFFNEVAKQGFDMKKLQGFKTEYQKRNIQPGEKPLDPKIGWLTNYEGVEKALMGGRSLLVMQVWQQTLVEFFNAHPEAVGVVYGQLDIGSWVNMTVEGLKFAADIDFSSLSTDAATNRNLVERFNANIKSASGLSMKLLDTPVTAHGQAEADVYIGDWGKVFAEKFGKLKILEMVRNENGYIVKVNMIEVEGKALLFQKSMEQESKSLEKNPADNYELKNDVELKMDMEPMFSLEMLRHAMTDAVKGPFEGAQKIIKMIKCTERSFKIQEMASANTNYNPKLSDAEIKLKTLCDNIVKNKNNSLEVAKLLEAFSGKQIESQDQVKELVTDIVRQCKQAMLKNSIQAFGFRIRTIAEIKDEAQRFAEADKFLSNLQEEFEKGFGKAGVDVPQSMKRARALLWEFRNGKVSPELMETKLQELNKIMEEDFNVDKSFVERWVGDAWVGLKNYLVKRGYDPESVVKIIEGWKKSAAEGWSKYAPELVKEGVTSTFKYVNHITEKCKAFDESLLQTEPGRSLHRGLTVAGYADMALSLYESWASGKDLYESGKRVGTSIAMMLSQAYVPFLAIPFGIYQAVETHNITPVVVGVMFYLFPVTFGGTYAVTNLIDKLVIKQISDYNFRYHLDRMALMSVTDGHGHIISFKIPNKFTGLTGSPDSTETEPRIAVDEPARTQTIKDVFYNMDVDHCPNVQYFKSLIPRKEDKWGEYDKKTANLVKLFSFDPEFAGYISMVDTMKRRKTNGWLPVDDFASNRDQILDELQAGIEDHFWKAVFTAIESTKQAEKEGAVAELEAQIVQLQDDLFMTDTRMKKIDSLSLLLKIRKQISNDPLYIQALKDKFSAGNAYERVAIPTLQFYIMTYKQIKAIQDKIFDTWRPFGVDATQFQQTPFELLLMGGLSGSPMLTTNPETDMKMALQCLEAHEKRAASIRMDLATALGRPIKETEKEDKEHLRILGEYGFGFERTVDASANGRSPNPYRVAITDILLKKGDEYVKAYKDYLAKIKEGPAINVTLKLEGENETTETNPVTAKITILDSKNKPVPLPAGTTLEWYLYDENTRKDLKVAEGPSYTHDAAKQGGFNYSIRLNKKVNAKQTLLANTYWNVTVKRFDATNPSKGIQLKVPSTIKQYDIFDATITVPAALKGKELKCNWGYSTIGKNDDCSGAKIQYNSELKRTDKNGKEFLVDSTTVDVYVTVMIPGKTYGEVYNVSRKVKYQHMSIDVKASDIWEGNSGPNWFHIERKPIKNPPRNAGWMSDKIARSTGSAYATVGLKDDNPMETINTLEDLKKYTDKKAKDLAYRKLEVKEVTVGDFKGYGLYSAPKYDPGGWSDAGYRPAGAGSSFSGYIMKGKKIFEVSWNAGASGAFDNEDQGWMMSMVKQLSAEAAGILSAASFKPDGRLTKSPYTGPKLDGSDFPKVSIEPKVDTIQPGSKISVKAVIKNDKPEYGPYTYTWSGQVDGNSTGSSAQLIADRPGKKTISVSVDGTTPPGSASMEYVVAPLKLRLTKVSPATNTIVVGMPVELRADFVSPVPAGKKLQYLWQPHPEEKFEPFEGNSNTTKVVFTKPGNKKIWVQVLDKTTAETITMGESDQLEFTVEKPGFTVSFNPPKALVGQQVTATIKSTPEKLEEVSYRWLPLPANAQLVKESQDGSEIIFYAKDALQIPLEVNALVKGSGEELGTAKAYFNAERYNVKADGPKIQGPKPMIWKPGVGLVEVEKEIAVHQIVEFTAVVTPAPASGLTYDWKVTQGNASISNPTSRDARVTALETGTIQVTVTVKDNNGVILGIAAGTFNATISDEMITNGTNQKKLFDEKMQQARKLLKEGKLDEAVQLGIELKNMNAKDAVPLVNELASACKNAATDAAKERDFDLAIKRCTQALQLDPNDTAAKKQLEDLKKWGLEWTTVKGKADQLNTAVQQKNLPAAQQWLNELNQLQQNMPGKQDNKWTQEKLRQYTALVNSCDSAFAITLNNSTTSFNANDFENSLKTLEAFKAIWTTLPPMAKEIESTIQTCRTRIAAQKKVYDDYVLIKSKFEKGQLTDPQQGPEYIESTAINTFSKNDPRQKEMIDFAKDMKKRQDEINVRKAKAEQLKTEGLQAEAAGLLDVAIRKYKESIALVPDAALVERIKILESGKPLPPDNKNVIQGTWTTQAHEYRENVGKRYTYFFPPGSATGGGLWGTDIYTTDCSIARAAVHAGLITEKTGGTVTIEIRPGQASYPGTTRNGITSNSWGSFYASFVFVKDNKVIEPVIIQPDASVIQGNWTTQANEYGSNTGKQYTFSFPPGGTISGRVWGTDIYTTDCSIASAAVHAGLITAKEGGTVTIEIRPGQPYYDGCTRNGVTSNDWGSYGSSFVFVKATTIVPDKNDKSLRLVAFYPFNGNTNDQGGANYTGTPRNGVSLTKDRFGKENSAYKFDGVDDYIEFPASGLPSKDRTVMFWLKPAPGNQPSYPLTYGGGSECGISFLMGFNAAGSKRFNTQGHCNTNSLNSDSWLMDPSGLWKHFAVTINGSAIKIYINGILMKTNNGFSRPTVVEGKKLIIGGLVGPEGITPYIDASGGYFKGDLDDIRIYNGVMTDEQVSAVFREQQQGTEIKTPPDDKGVNPANTKTEEKVFDNGNIGAVSSGPPNPTQFTFNRATFITRIENYHYFNGGKKPGTIGLRNNSTGKVYGPWQAYGILGQGGVQNASWDVLPNIEIPAGTYTVIDSDPSTWSYNSESKGCGFTNIWTSKFVQQPVPDNTGVKPADASKEQKVFENGNIGGVSSGPPNPTQFTFTKPTIITRIENYHYFNGGKKPGTIGLRNNSTGKVYGPWQAYGLIGQGGVQNANWDVLPNTEIPAGTYTVIDSDPSTWSYNSQSNGCGFTTIWTSKGNQPVTNPNDPGYTIEEVETGGGVTAEKICISGDIDNLGFGFPKGFDVFSGNSTPSHSYPWTINPADAAGTDRIMVGTGAKGNSDGYSGNTSRPANLPQAITLGCMTSGMHIQSAVLQLFVDDFQAAAFGSSFTVTINGRRAAFLETVINSLNQTGPIGKLISVQFPAEFISEVQSGKLVIYIDDATSGRGDGYAIDFVRLIINPTSYSYTGTITGIVLRPDGQPASGASINAGGMISTTANSKGEFTLKNVPAGMVSINASYNNHHHKTITTDLASGKTIRITINLPQDDAIPTTQQPTRDTTNAVGWVGIERGGILYGTVFKTKEEAGKTNPFDLEGVPLPNIPVTIEYQYNFTNYKKSATSDGNGKFQFTDLPLTVAIRITSRGQVVTKTLTTASPKQYVQIGWDGEITIK